MDYRSSNLPGLQNGQLAPSGRRARGIVVLHGSHVLLFAAMFFVFFFPSSLNGNIITNMYMVRNGMGILIALLLVAKNSLQKKPFIWAFVLLAWLSILTLTTYVGYTPNDFRVAFASISGFLPTVLIWCLTLKRPAPEPLFARRMVNVISMILIVWGWCLVLNIPWVYNFTKNLYSQLKENMFDNMVTIRGKPVMSFGTHSMAAFFILIAYYYNCILIRERQETPLTYVFMALLFLLQVPMRSTTSMVAMGVMLFLLIWARNNHYTRIFTAVALLGVVIYFFRTGFIRNFTSDILYGTNANHHGFDARYLSGIYDGNIEMITHYVGVGFLRSASNLFRMNDSGFIYLLTQGNLPAVIITYGLMYGFFKRNMAKYARMSFLMFFIWEFISATTFISVKMVFAHLMTLLLINSLRQEDAEGVDNR